MDAMKLERERIDGFEWEVKGRFEGGVGQFFREEKLLEMGANVQCKEDEDNVLATKWNTDITISTKKKRFGITWNLCQLSRNVSTVENNP